MTLTLYLGFPGGSDSEELAAKQETQVESLVGKILWRRDAYPLQYFCPENSMDRGAWQTTVYGVAKSQTWLSDEC